MLFYTLSWHTLFSFFSQLSSPNAFYLALNSVLKCKISWFRRYVQESYCQAFLVASCEACEALSLYLCKPYYFYHLQIIIHSSTYHLTLSPFSVLQRCNFPNGPIPPKNTNQFSLPILSLSLFIFLYISLKNSITSFLFLYRFLFFNYALIARPWKYFVTQKNSWLEQASIRPVIRVIYVLRTIISLLER